MHAPGGLHKLLPYDRVGIIATDAQMQTFNLAFDTIELVDAEESNMEDIVLQKILVDEHTRLKGLSIKNSCIGERTNGLVVGIEKNGTRILNPHSSTVFEWNDIAWIVGDRNKIQQMTQPTVS